MWKCCEKYLKIPGLLELLLSSVGWDDGWEDGWDEEGGELGWDEEGWEIKDDVFLTDKSSGVSWTGPNKYTI